MTDGEFFQMAGIKPYDTRDQKGPRAPMPEPKQAAPAIEIPEDATEEEISDFIFRAYIDEFARCTVALADRDAALKDAKRNRRMFIAASVVALAWVIVAVVGWLR